MPAGQRDPPAAVSKGPGHKNAGKSRERWSASVGGAFLEGTMLRERGSKGEAEERTELNLAVALRGESQELLGISPPRGCLRAEQETVWPRWIKNVPAFYSKSGSSCCSSYLQTRRGIVHDRTLPEDAPQLALQPRIAIFRLKTKNPISQRVQRAPCRTFSFLQPQGGPCSEL